MRLLSHPMRLTPSGRFATVESGTDGEVNEAIAILIGTRLGERPMMPAFGVPDPAWLGLRPADVNTALGVYGPDGVEVVAVDAATDGAGEQAVTLQWERT